MKTKFWKNLPELIGFALLFSVSIIIDINGIIFSQWIMVGVSSLIILILGIYCFIKRNTISRISFSEKDIKVSLFNKITNELSWDEITDIKELLYARSSYYLVFESNSETIQTTLTRKMYVAIMMLCPYPNIKMKINNLQCTQWYQRKKNKPKS